MVIPFKIKLENKLTDDEKGNFRIIKQGHLTFLSIDNRKILEDSLSERPTLTLGLKRQDFLE